MESYFQILKVNLKFNLIPHVLIAFLLVLAAPFIMGLENLNPIQVAQTLEVYTSLLGIILMVPLFTPDQDRNIRDLIKSKKEPMIKIHLMRIVEALFFLSIIVRLFLLNLKYGQSEFPFGKYFYGTMANCIFLGGLGVIIFSIIDHLAVSYMVPILYYILNYGSGEKLGMFNMFSMMRGSFIEKNYLFSVGVLFILAAIVYRHKK
ncbi:MAG: hypothetical protein GX053_03660 [Tissierella sp.]|nr:hypothetical protein [Tissierella sp.]